MQHKIAYDSIKKWVRWDRSGNVERQGVQETIITWTDYNKLIEYVYWVEQNKCEPYGPDAFYDWCYGNKVSQVSTGSINVAGKSATTWKSKFTDIFQWVSQDDQCLPLSTVQFGGFTTNFFNTTVGAPTASTWNLPSMCESSSFKRSAATQSPFFMIRP